MGTPAPVSRTNKKSNVMLQKAKKKYTVKTLKPLNVLYDHELWLTLQDVDLSFFLNGFLKRNIYFCIKRDKYEKYTIYHYISSGVMCM